MSQHDENAPSHIGNSEASALRAWRNRMGWGRDEAAAQLGLKRDTYKKLENGQRPVTARLMAEARRLEQLGSARVTPVADDRAAIHVVGGGTIVHVRNHLALAAPAYGSTAREIAGICTRQGHAARLTLTRMADPSSPYETNDDMSRLAREITANPHTRIVFWNPAICDFTGQVGDVAPARKARRLKTAEGAQAMQLTPADKIVAAIRRERKDIFLVAFKTTTGATEDEMYMAGLKLMKGAHINLVLVNDVVNRMNMVVTPEEARYHVTAERVEALEGLVEMALLRSRSTFTRSSVVEGSAGVPWESGMIADNLRAVVNHCIKNGAYKPLKTKRGAVTVGHFAARGPEGKIVTSRRWSNFNELDKTGMVLIEPKGLHSVIAYGGKPSVGGQSQRIIFTDHPALDNIVHFHCPLKEDAPQKVPMRPQRPYECGSHECGKNTSDGLREMEDGIWAVMLDQHGPNIVFRKDVPAERVIAFIERNFDLSDKTGGHFHE
jgi:DNA-binding XRE family transcriptional regulator